jgi:titin
VTIKVAVPPVAIDHTYTVPGGTASTITADQGVLLHDVDPQSLPLQAKLVAGPASGGSVTLQPDGSFTLTPAPGFAGTLTFTYQAYDSVASSNTATVTVNVIGPPVAYDVAYAVAAGETLHVPAPGVLGKDTDPSGLPLTVASHGAPGSGTLTINPDGSFDYTPAQGFSGLDSFTYVVTDGQTSSNTARVDITVTSPPPPIASDHAYTITAGQTLHGSVAELLANDTDPSGLPLSVKSLTSPMFGTVALNSDGSFNFTPFAGFSGIGSFTYTISDSIGLTASATVVVTVRPQSPPPPPPYVLGIVGSTRSRRGLTSIEIAFDEALNAISAQDGDYTLLLGVKKRGHVVYGKNVCIRGIQYDGNNDTVAINFAKPTKDPVQVTVRKGIAAANGAMSIADFSTIVN